MRLIKDRNVNIITDEDNHKVILINDIMFKGKRNINREEVKEYLMGYVGDSYQIEADA